MTDPLPDSGTTLIVGPSNAGKTRRTAAALDAWLDREGPEGVVVFEFAPELERNGRILGGRLDRFTTVPGTVWHGIVDAHAPRTTGESASEAADLAADNARRAVSVFDAAPADPRAVFVNDATIPFQRPAADPDRLLDYCDDAAVAVLNALAGDALAGDDSVSRAERETLAALRRRADRVIELDGGET
ncbi:hypothetical protein ACOZ4L_10810 [Haloplanus ruber]|uniref:ATP-binding protein n=1 Tax=Haloplanus ruber TaxID=869892 RepID=A0ABD6CUQ1_9EURY